MKKEGSKFKLFSKLKSFATFCVSLWQKGMKIFILGLIVKDSIPCQINSIKKKHQLCFEVMQNKLKSFIAWLVASFLSPDSDYSHKISCNDFLKNIFYDYAAHFFLCVVVIFVKKIYIKQACKEENAIAYYYFISILKASYFFIFFYLRDCTNYILN